MVSLLLVESIVSNYGHALPPLFIQVSPLSNKYHLLYLTNVSFLFAWTFPPLLNNVASLFFVLMLTSSARKFCLPPCTIVVSLFGKHHLPLSANIILLFWKILLHYLIETPVDSPTKAPVNSPTKDPINVSVVANFIAANLIVMVNCWLPQLYWYLIHCLTLS